MSRSITIGGVERAGLTRLESFSFQESAYRGEAGQGGFDVDSEGGTPTVSAWKDVVAIDSDGGQFFTGQTVDRGVGRGAYSTDEDAMWDVQVIDINTIMDDILLRGAEWNRPEETDVERMQALLDELNDAGYNIDDTYLLTTAPEDMDAQDYRKQGVLPRAVADECAENSGKNWYLFWNTDIGQLGIWYGRETSSLRTSAYGISSVLDDVDNNLTWAAEWPEDSGLTLDPSRVYSAVQVVYGDPPHSTYVNRPATEAAFKRRETILFDASVKTETKAIKLANHYLDYSETEDATITVAVTLPTELVNAYQHGQRIAIRAPHLGYDSPTYMRCRTRTIEPAGGETKAPGLYRVTLVLKPSVKVTRFGGRGTNDVPGQGDNTDQGDVEPPAELTDVGEGTCVTGDPRTMLRYNPGDGSGIAYALGGSGSGGSGAADVGSWVYNNVPYTDADFGCPIGGGSWKGFSDNEIWVAFTAPADDPTEYLGIQTSIDLSALNISGSVFGYHLKHATGALAATRWGEGSFVGVGPTSGLIKVFIPRNRILWGGVNALILHPNWLCPRATQFCNGIAYFGNPHDDGRADSGGYDGFGFPDDFCTVSFVVNTSGWAPWVPGYGNVDGANSAFQLIHGTGSGAVEAKINGLVVDSSALAVSGTTVTFAQPPPAGSTVTFRYRVSA